MCYDFLFSFADKNQDNFNKFQLPRYTIGNPEGEEVIIPRGLVATSRPSTPNNPASSINTDYASVQSDENDTIYTRTDPDDWACLEKGLMGVILIQYHILAKRKKSQLTSLRGGS